MHNDILQALLMEGHDELVKQSRKPWRKFYLYSKKELADVYMDNLTWMKAMKKDPIHKKIMVTPADYVGNDMFDPDEAMAAAVNKRKFLLKRLLEDRRRFPEQ